MERKLLKYGNHVITNDNDGYTYSFNTSKSYDFNSHMHKCYEFIHVIHGKLLYTVEGSEYMLSDGDFIMTNPAELHSFSFPAECDYQREFLHVYPGFIDRFPELTNPLDERKTGYFNRFSAEVVRQYKIDKIFKDMEDCCSHPSPETDSFMLAHTLRLITSINQVLRETLPEQQIAVNKKANAVRDYIDKHYTNEISVEDIANALFISPSRLSHIFKRETGMTIKAYLNMRRITQAKSLIMEEGQMIKNIYWKCGYSDYSTFYRAFIKYTGMSPDEFKHMHTNKKE